MKTGSGGTRFMRAGTTRGRAYDGRRKPGRAWARLTMLPLAALAVTMVAAPVASAATTYYAVGKPVCKPAKSGQSTCYAVKRVLVKSSTPGAAAFKLGAGATAAGTIGPAGGLTPSDFTTAYGLSTSTGTGQTIAIVDAFNDPKIKADLATFDSNYGIAAPPSFTVMNQTGGSTLPANDTSGWAVEETLDVQSAHSICPKCSLILVEANSSSDSDLGIAENTAASKAGIVTNSFGGPESGSTSTFQSSFNHPDKVILASSGDDGYYNFDCLFKTGCSPANQPNTPAAFNTVVAVGGTSLYLTQSGTRSYESVWNDNGPKAYWAQNFGTGLGAGGGGCSTLFTAQGWQTNESGWSTTGCGTKRLVADVSADADYLTGFDLYLSYDCGGACSTGWQTIGGTSLASPLIAGVEGLAGGAQNVAYPALTLYGHPGTAYDVTTGGNDWCDGLGGATCGAAGFPNPNVEEGALVTCAFPATGNTPTTGNRACTALSGYDGPTGVGTPKGLTAFTKVKPAVTVSGPTSIAHGTTGTWKASVTDPFPGGKPTTYTFSWGDGTANTVVSSSATSLSETHKYAAAASRTITVTVADNYGLTGSKTYPVTVS
jgi:hypothetical protein